jgi:hypothetical protein
VLIGLGIDIVVTVTVSFTMRANPTGIIVIRYVMLLSTVYVTLNILSVYCGLVNEMVWNVDMGKVVISRG